MPHGPQEDWENPDNWRAGLFYYAPHDPRTFVPKRCYGGSLLAGVTLNYAQPLSWIIMGVALILPALWVRQEVLAFFRAVP